MINIGNFNRLEVLKEVDFGLFLGDGSGMEVLLPNRYCPSDYSIGDKLNVFIYLDKTDRMVATNLIPKITLHEFAYLRVEEITEKGAFLDWGMPKHLFVPKREQKNNMEIGEYYFVYMLQDERTEKLYGTNRVERYIEHDDLTVKKGDKVDLTIYQNAGIGYSAIINNLHKGMIYKNEIFRSLDIGMHITGYVKQIREDDKIDLSLQPIGYKKSNDPNCEIILKLLDNCNGFIPLNDKSKPDEISKVLEMSKKSFKKAIGSLYKAKKIVIEKDGIRLI